jgi:hypothetical protein
MQRMWEVAPATWSNSDLPPVRQNNFAKELVLFDGRWIGCRTSGH